MHCLKVLVVSLYPGGPTTMQPSVFKGPALALLAVLPLSCKVVLMRFY